ncbi:MAG: selenium metabolism-associated LysR family transcriptional regulator [Nitrospirota bacterium]
MEDHKLKVFCAVAETKSFSKASEIIHLTQPAVSLQIQALEETYGTKLFDRSNNTITLTPSGQILYRHAKEILSRYNSVEKEISELTGLVKGHLTIGASSTIGNYLLPCVIVAFRKKYPEIKLSLLVGNTRAIIERLNAGAIDIALVEGYVQKQKLVVEKLISDELVLIIPPEHPWEKRDSISISELEKEPFIIREEGSGTRQVIEKYLLKQNITLQRLKISLILGSTEAIKTAVERGMGVAIVSAWAVRKEVIYGFLKSVPFKEIKFLRDFSLVYQKKTFVTPSFEEFIEFLKVFPLKDPLKDEISFAHTPCGQYF